MSGARSGDRMLAAETAGSRAFARMQRDHRVVCFMTSTTWTSRQPYSFVSLSSLMRDCLVATDPTIPHKSASGCLGEPNSREKSYDRFSRGVSRLQ